MYNYQFSFLLHIYIYFFTCKYNFAEVVNIRKNLRDKTETPETDHAFAPSKKGKKNKINKIEKIATLCLSGLALKQKTRHPQKGSTVRAEQLSGVTLSSRLCPTYCRCKSIRLCLQVVRPCVFPRVPAPKMPPCLVSAAFVPGSSVSPVGWIN